MEIIIQNKIKVPFLDLKVSNPIQKKRYLARIDRMLSHGQILEGPEIEEFESQVATYCGSKFAIGVGSGTDALVLALKALGIEKNDEIIVPCLSFIGTANAIASLDAKPVFVDISTQLTIDDTKIKSAITSRTKAIMPVHFTGRLSPMPEILSISKEYNIPVIEDAAPAFGATYLGQKAGTFGIMGCLSMNPMKILNALGEAGVVLTNNQELKDKIISYRYHGLNKNKDICSRVSTNRRLDTLQAAILLERLADIDKVIHRRREIAKRYTEKLSQYVLTPKDPLHYKNVYYTYTILTKQNEPLAKYLLDEGIETKFYHKRLMTEHTPYINNHSQVFEIGNRVVKELLCLPLHEKLSDEQVEHVINTIKNYFE